MLTQFILGLGAAISYPSYDGLFSINLDEGRQYSEWADWTSLNFIFTGIAGIIGAFVAGHFGFTALFIMMGFSSLISLALVFLFKKIDKKV